MIRVRLDEQEFRDLVRGAVVKTRSSQGEEVELILADIGFARMLDLVKGAIIEVKTSAEYLEELDKSVWP